MKDLTLPSRKTSTSDVTFAPTDLARFCRLDELGLEVTGQRVELGRAVLPCPVTEPDQLHAYRSRARDGDAGASGLAHDAVQGDAGAGGLSGEPGAQVVSGVPLGGVPGGVVEQRDGGFDDQGDGLAVEPGVRVGLAGVPRVPCRVSGRKAGESPCSCSPTRANWLVRVHANAYTTAGWQTASTQQLLSAVRDVVQPARL